MKQLLITGFDPFGGEAVNPSWEAVRRLSEEIGSYRLTRLQIPTVFDKAAQTVLDAAAQLTPHVILCIGQAGGRSAVTPEAVAINLREARIADNEGFQPVNEPVIANGPAAYFATVPVRRMVKAMKDAGFPARLSYSAGAYVCNDVLYTLLHALRDTPIQVGFIHVPFLPQQGTPNMELDQITRALTAAIEGLHSEPI